MDNHGFGLSTISFLFFSFLFFAGRFRSELIPKVFSSFFTCCFACYFNNQFPGVDPDNTRSP
jgi:hypothetical protein